MPHRPSTGQLGHAAQAAEFFGTPIYVYDANKIRERVALARVILGRSTTLYYSVKANPNLTVLALMQGLGVGAEVSSAGECVLAREAGFRPSSIVLVGPGKTASELQRAIDGDVRLVHVESEAELQRLDEMARAARQRVPIALRVNSNLRPPEAREIMGGAPSRFGIDEERLPDVATALAKASLDIQGLHIYSGSQIWNVDWFADHFQHTADLVNAVELSLGTSTSYLNVGGGWAVPYSEDDPDFDATRMREVFCAAAPRLTAGGRRELAVELGRFLVAEAGAYVTRVVDVKESRGRHYVITDGGINHFIRPAFMNAFHPIAVVSAGGVKVFRRPNRDGVRIGGPLCTPLDEFGAIGSSEVLDCRIGDLVVVMNAGAYGFTMSMNGFLGFPAPAEAVVLDDKIELVRTRGTAEGLLAGQCIPAALAAEEATA